jgi:hypothetical protein
MIAYYVKEFLRNPRYLIDRCLTAVQPLEPNHRTLPPGSARVTAANGPQWLADGSAPWTTPILRQGLLSHLRVFAKIIDY